MGYREIEAIEGKLAQSDVNVKEKQYLVMCRGLCYMYEGEPAKGYDDFTLSRSIAVEDPQVATEWLSTLIFLQGVAGLRRGESENCIHCRGEGACIFPILPTAVHTQPEGSRLAVRHFTEYLDRHAHDAGVQWLLNIAYMTLGEYPREVPSEHLIPLDTLRSDTEHGIGAFRDIAHLAKVNRLSQAGGAIMEDFDNDGRLDIVASCWDAAVPLAFYHNEGDGTFEDRTEQAGLQDQLGGLSCMQTDYNNDGLMDIYVVRGAWYGTPMRPSLLKNVGDGRFADVTAEAGLMDPVNAIAAKWGDYDNDGHLDLFVGCDRSRNRLYHNDGSGKFEEVALAAGVSECRYARGASWGDFDADGYPDLFVNNLMGPPQLFRNQGDGTFRDVARKMKVVGPTTGFACWFWDYDNDGWLDIFATSYERSLNDIVKSLQKGHVTCQTDHLYRNVLGGGFEDVSFAARVNNVTAPMGANFADFDNDGFLDFYLGTGEPAYSTLVPNRMYRNLAGKKFADITFSSRTGHLQKGHGVACGDWNRDGNVDLFVELGGATPGDVFHDALFQNPGNHGNHWLNVKLVGKQTNQAAIGARIKVVTAGSNPQTIYRHVDGGASFGANPLEQMIGVGRGELIDRLEVYWPTSGTTQRFQGVAVDQALEITEFASEYRRLDYQQISTPN